MNAKEIANGLFVKNFTRDTGNEINGWECRIFFIYLLNNTQNLR